MTGAPDFIDNLDGNTLAAAVASILAEGAPGPDGLREASPPPGRLDIATAFFSPAGFSAIAPALETVERIRLLLGAEPYGDVRPPQRRLGETPPQFERRLLRERLTEFDDGLREERDRVPFTREGRAGLRRLIDTAREGRMEVRRYERAFLHAKAYIFKPPLDGLAGDAALGAGVIAGSSNLTRAGVLHNLELNLGAFDPPRIARANAWYQRLWEEAEPYEFADILEEVFLPRTPFDVFLKVLDRLYSGEIEEEAKADEGLPLTNFQKHGAARALRLIRESGGAIVADEVGLGKTFIAGEILSLYHGRRQRCLLICPAQLRDTTWRKFRSRFFLNNVECVSYEQLAIDRQIGLAEEGHLRDVLDRPLEEYQLVVVDEAHNYRNRDTPTRAQVLRRLLYGQPRDLLLLTATPVNNTLWDLYNLLLYYIRQDSFLADRGILSIRERFASAAREDPSALSPDVLFPIIDATTVKRTRQFVKKHYGGDMIRLPDGSEAVIVFPSPVAKSVRYPLTDPMPALFEQLERAINPDGAPPEALSFARYDVDRYLIGPGSEEERHEIEARAAATMGLLRSGLLKRFESSAHAFLRTISKLIREHERFLMLLEQGWVVSTAFLKEIAGAADDELEDLLAQSDTTRPAALFRVDALRAAVSADLALLHELRRSLSLVTPDRDPKLRKIIEELEAIAAEAEAEAHDDDDARQRRKVLIFSFFADTVRYLREELGREIAARPALAAYRDRIVAVAGSVDVEEAEIGRQRAVAGFAPISMEATEPEDLFDVLISTDVLAEGVNLQQCRHIINYDVPWNPMRLVQRHGRVDRIGSPHSKVFLRTVFPAERLDQLLKLEEKIIAKIAMAAASVGVVSPVEGGAVGRQVFAETREEIEKLLAEDAGLFERGGSAGAGQTGEEYRQTLRKALLDDPRRIARLPSGVGSGMKRGPARGMFFCAAIGERTYLRFVHAEPGWKPVEEAGLVREVGTCLRLIECEDATPRHLDPAAEAAVFDFWAIARADVHASWMAETDPANLQPRVRPLNQRVADFIRAHAQNDADAKATREALDILEAPWPRREEILLRQWFDDNEKTDTDRALDLVRQIRGTGLRPFVQPPLLPPIEPDQIEIVAWLALEAE